MLGNADLSPHRRSDSILLFGFGLALALSLAFNGFLLYKQSQRQRLHKYETGSAVQAVDELVWQRELSDCQQVNQRKDSLIARLEKAPKMPPVQAVVQHHPSK